MDFKEAIDYMQKTGKHVVIVTNYPQDVRIECRLGLSNRFGIPSPACLQRSVCLSDRRLEWKDVDLNDLCRLVACLSYEFESLVEYVSFVDAVKQIKDCYTCKQRVKTSQTGFPDGLICLDGHDPWHALKINQYPCWKGIK